MDPQDFAPLQDLLCLESPSKGKKADFIIVYGLLQSSVG